MGDQAVTVLTGMPRSGTSWLSQIFDSHPDVAFRLSPLFSYDLKNALDERSPRDDIERVFRAAAAATDHEFMTQSAKRADGSYPTFGKSCDPSHLVIKQTRFHQLLEPWLERIDDLRVVCIVRHPCGAIHSWLTTPKEFPAAANAATEWRHGRCRKTDRWEFWGFDDWTHVTRHHLHLAERFPDRVTIVRYEDLVHDRVGTTNRLFARCGLRMNAQTERFLDQSGASHAADTHAVFKSPAVADRWRDELSPEIRDAIISEVSGTELAQFLTQTTTGAAT